MDRCSRFQRIANSRIQSIETQIKPEVLQKVLFLVELLTVSFVLHWHWKTKDTTLELVLMPNRIPKLCVKVIKHLIT